MKTKHTLPLVIFLTLLMLLISAAAFAFLLRFLPESSPVPAEELSGDIYADRFPWLEKDIDHSARALDFVDGEMSFDEERLNTFARNAIIGSIPQNYIPHKAISEKSFADAIMISRDDFQLWLKDYRFTTEGGQTYTCGFAGYSGNYEMIFSAYCVRDGVTDTRGAWRECDPDEYAELLGIESRDNGNHNIYSDEANAEEISPDIESGNMRYYSFGDKIIMTYVDSIAQKATEYAYSLLDHSGFESLDEIYYSMYVEAIMDGSARAYINGELMLISIDEDLPTVIHLFYDLGTENFCGWIRE